MLILKNSILPYFLKIKVLDVTSEGFKYTSFSFTEIFAEMTAPDFPFEQLVGKQAEYLFEQLLKHSSKYKLLDSNIQIQGERETIGELDYLIKDMETQAVYHVELACKWYLLDPSLGKLFVSQWIGPNRKDRLSDKLDKLHKKQFPLLYRQETRATLERLSLASRDIVQKLCLKAFLFVPISYNIEELPSTYKSCIVGRYLRATQWHLLDRTAQYAFPKKKEWLQPVEANHIWVSHTEALQKIETFTEERWSAMVYVKSGTTIRTLFVVWW